MENEYYFIVVGAGPAGMMAAIRASERGKQVIILEKNSSAGKKLLLCGGRRCNITNGEEDPQLFVSNYMKNPQFMFSMLSNLSNKDVCEFFEKAGVKLKTEPDQRIFPKSNKSSDVLDVLLKKLEKLNVPVIYGAPVTSITKENEKIKIETPKGIYYCDKVLIATGGKTKQKTGSSGDGFVFAKSLGHRVIDPKKALYPFQIKEVDICRRLNGLSLENAGITFKNSAGIIFKENGPIMFANFGLTGPTMINASLKVSNAQLSSLRILINFFPDMDEPGMDNMLLKAFKDNINRSIENTLSEILPRSLTPVVLDLSNIDKETRTNEITREQREKIAKLLISMEFTVSSYVLVNRSIATDGGIDLKEINNKTLESKISSGVYFAGEILDVIGRTGGFNLQAAWSTGWTVGNMV